MDRTGLVKRGSKPDRERLREVMRASGCTVDQIAAEMGRRWGFRPRSAWRYANSLSQEQVAARFNSLVGNTGRHISSKRISDYEAWPVRGMRPTPAVLAILARIYDATPNRLVDMADIKHMSAEDVALLGILEHSTPKSVLIAPGAAESSARPLAAFSNLQRNESKDLDIMAAAHESSEHAADAESTNVGATTLEQMRDEVSHLAHALMRDDPVAVFAQVIRVRDRVYRVLEGHQHPGQTRELYLLAAVCCCLLADASHLLGYRAAALEQTRAAWAYAEIIGHDSLRVWCRSMQSWLAYSGDRPQQSVALARSGMRYASNPTSRLRLLLMEGTAHAAMGDAREAERAFMEAEGERERVNAPDDLFDEIGGSFGMPIAKQYHNAAAGYIHLGMAEKAAASADQAIELYLDGPAYERDDTIVSGARITLATSRLLMRDVDAAHEDLRPVFDLPAHLHSDSLSMKLRELRAALRMSRFRDSTAAIALESAIEEFTELMLPAGLPEDRR